jgi:hypothetical protein
MHRLSDITLAKYFTVFFRQFVGQSEQQLKNSEKFVQRKQSITLQDTDILASFDVLSVFTGIPLENTTANTFTELHRQTLGLIKRCPNNHNFLHVLVLPTEGRSVHTISPDAGGGRLASCETL